jgi:hypothetical protein
VVSYCDFDLHFLEPFFIPFFLLYPHPICQQILSHIHYMCNIQIFLTILTINTVVHAIITSHCIIPASFLTMCLSLEFLNLPLPLNSISLMEATVISLNANQSMSPPSLSFFLSFFFFFCGIRFELRAYTLSYSTSPFS